jgi:lipid-A-disaccharide synthase
MNNSLRPPRILFAAGEVSGDRQAAYLARTILSKEPRARLYGTGGEMMRQSGVDIIVQTSQYGCVGVQESLRFVRPLRRVMQQLRRLIRQDPPDLAVLVDNEGFNTVLSKFLHSEGIPFIYYFPPQVWLWGEWRARSIAERARAIIPAFEQEAEIYRKEGGEVFWVGHPLLDIVKPRRTSKEAFALAGLNPNARSIALMPGSRLQEVEQLLSPMLQAAKSIKTLYPDVQFLLPPAAPHLVPAITERIAHAGMTSDVHLIASDVYAFLSRCELAILSSGTATLEAALLGVPMVVAYRVSAITYLLARRLLKCRFITMPNILLNDLVVPELIQQHVTPEAVAHEACSILNDDARSKEIKERLLHVKDKLGKKGALNAVAEFVLQQASDNTNFMAA